MIFYLKTKQRSLFVVEKFSKLKQCFFNYIIISQCNISLGNNILYYRYQGLKNWSQLNCFLFFEMHLNSRSKIFLTFFGMTKFSSFFHHIFVDYQFKLVPKSYDNIHSYSYIFDSTIFNLLLYLRKSFVIICYMVILL